MGRLRKADIGLTEFRSDLAQYASTLASPVQSAPKRMPDLLTYDESSSSQKFSGVYPIVTDDAGNAAGFLYAHPTTGVLLTSSGTTAASYLPGNRGLTAIAQNGIGPYGTAAPGNAAPWNLSNGNTGWMPQVENAAGAQQSLPYGELAVVQAALRQASSARVTAFGADLPGLVNAVLNQQGTIAVRYDKSSSLYPDLSPNLRVAATGGFAYLDQNLINFKNAAQSVACDPRPCVEGETAMFSTPISGASDWHPTSATAFVNSPGLGDDSTILEFMPSTTDLEQSIKLARVTTNIVSTSEFRTMCRTSYGAWETIMFTISGAAPNTHIYDMTVAMHMELIPLTRAVTFGDRISPMAPPAGVMEVAPVAARAVRDNRASGKWKERLRTVAGIGSEIISLFAPGAASKALQIAGRIIGPSLQRQ